MRGVFDNLWGVAAAWLFAFSLCLAGWVSLDSPRAEQARVARAGGVASAELAEAVATRSPELAALTRALLVREDTGFAWLRVRDVEGYPLAAAGRLEPAGGAQGSGWLAVRVRRFVYGAISSEHRVVIDHQGRVAGSIEFGLLSGAVGAGAGALTLLLGVPVLIFFSLRLGQVFAREWRSSAQPVRASAAVAVPAPRPRVAAAVPVSRPAPAAAALDLLAAFDHSVFLIGREQRIADLNPPAAQLIGKRPERLRGLRLPEVLSLFQVDLRHPVVLPLDDCLAGRLAEFRGNYYLRAGDKPLREIECSLRPVRDATGAISGVLLTLVEIARPAAGAAAPPVEVEAPELSRRLLEQVLENVIATDSQDRIHFANARALENLGYALTEIRHQHISRLLPEPFLRKPEARVADYAGQGVAPQAVMARRRDGSEFAATMSVLALAQRGVEGHVLTIRRKVAALGDARVGPRLRQLLAATEGELLAVDPETLAVVVANAHACDALGHTPEALAQMTLPRVIPKLGDGVLRDCLARLWRDPETQVEADAVQSTANGTERPIRLRMSLWRREGEPLLLVSAQPSARGRYPAMRRGEETAEFLAEHDPATGLPNRKLFMRRLEAAVAAQQPFAVAQIALTGVAEAAASHPQDTTDRLLRVIADRLCAVVGAADTVARIATDEFALLLRGPGLAQEGRAILRRHLTVFSRPFRAGVLEFKVSATAGVTAFPEDRGDAATLLRHVAAALQLARPQEIAMHDERARLAADRRGGDGFAQLREAQAAGQADIELQPLMDTRARLIAGAEVLLSWREPGQRRLRASAELRQAGASPALLEALPVWLFEQACEQHARWRDLELPALPLLFDASAVTLTRRDLHQLRGLLARFHVPPEQLLLMVSGAELESLLLQSDGWLPLARDMGLRLGVDDVVNARPDLLRRIDADLVRLARNTTAGLPAAQASEQTGAGIIAGQRIGALVLAEGVERAEQREALINLGCYLQQGRLLGEAMPPREFSRLLTRAEVGAF